MTQLNTGFYEFTGRPEALTLRINGITAEGQLTGSLGDSDITGQYDSSTNSIAFDIELLPGDPFLSAIYYVGFAIGPPDGQASALAGTYSEVILTVHPPGITRVTGGWFATYSFQGAK
jgi:hypothetical protein